MPEGRYRLGARTRRNGHWASALVKNGCMKLLRRKTSDNLSPSDLQVNLNGFFSPSPPSALRALPGAPVARKSLISYNCFNCQALPEGGDQAGVAEQVSTWGGEHLLPGGQAPQRI